MMNSGRTNSLEIRTPEGIVFSILLAEPVTRCLAWLIDAACISVLTGIASNSLRMFGILSVDISLAITTLAYFAISIGYGMALEWFWRGQTLGKRLLRLRVVDEQGLRLQ